MTTDTTNGDTETNILMASLDGSSSSTLRNVPVLHSRKDTVFYDRLKELKAFREKYGHVQVPITHRNKKLFHWIKNKRSEESDFKEGRRKAHPFSEVEEERLAEVGFLFDVSVSMLTKCFHFLLYNTRSFKV